MTKFMLIVAVASLSIVNASFAWAQAAVQEPGLYAFYHPDGDVLHAGPGQYGSRAEPYGANGVRHAMASATIVRPAPGGINRVGRNNRAHNASFRGRRLSGLRRRTDRR
jgi:hypothetical protein